jgi:type II secretory pathway pseudopilin PulG
MKKPLCLMLAAAGSLLLFSVPGRSDDNAAAPVVVWMEALKAQNWLALPGQVGIALSPEMRQRAQALQTLVPWRVVDYKVLGVTREHDGVALVTVRETSERGAVPGLPPEVASTLTTGNVTVEERFVVVQLDGQWQIDFSHSGLPASSLNWLQLADEQNGEPALKQLGQTLNQAGLGQITCSLAGSMPTLGIVSAALVPNFRRAQARGQLTACASNQKNIATALEMYASDYSGRYPRQLAPLRSAQYLRSIPSCPSARADTYSETYQVSTKPDAFTFFCRGHHHEKAGVGPNLPAYSSHEGLNY